MSYNTIQGRPDHPDEDGDDDMMGTCKTCGGECKEGLDECESCRWDDAPEPLYGLD